MRVGRIGIIGTGALASYVAGRLGQVDGVDVVMVGRWQEHISAIQQNGLTIIEQDGTQKTVHIDATSNWHGVQPVDAVLVMTKTYQEASAFERTKAIAGDDSPIFLLWNGLSAAEPFHTTFHGRVTNGILLIAAHVTPGRVQHKGSLTIQFALTEDEKPTFKPTIDLLETAGINTPIYDDLQKLRWSKAVINAAINPLTALLDVPNGYLATDSVARGIMIAAGREAEAVATALGIELVFEDCAAECVRIVTISAENQSSMVMDMRRGRQTEIDTITLPIITEARRLDILTPINDALYDAIAN